MAETAPTQRPGTEAHVHHSEDQQNTGNHKQPDAADAGGADRFGGTRAGAENVEPVPGARQEGEPPKVELEHNPVPLNAQLSVQGAAERTPERDEGGRA